MSDEEKAPTPSPAGDSVATAGKARKWPIVIAVFAIILAVIFVAFLHWHEQPTFCNAFCHQPMDKYVEGYYSQDKSMEVTVHEENGVTCLSCHWPQAKMLDLVHEVVYYATDQFTDPLPAHQYAQGDQDAFVSDSFCGRCHDGTTAPTKESATEGWTFDPHNIPQDVAMHQTAGHDGGAIQCGDCHTIHKGSTFICAECHGSQIDQSQIPDGWTIPTDKRAEVAEQFGPYDMHSIITTDSFKNVPFHETAGADGGEITCTDCHTESGENVFICAECHYTNYEDLIPAGWTVPDHTTDIDVKTAATSSFGALDPHTLLTSDMFTGVEFHQTAGANGGMITCTDCHTPNGNVFICSECHASSYASLVPDGWTIPDSEVDMPLPGAPTDDSAATDASASSDESAAADSSASDSSAAASDATYKDGTYTSTQKGIGGDVPVTVTISGGVITDVTVGDNSETQGVGSKAIDQLPGEIVAANGTDGVDGVSGASVTSKAIFDAVNDCLQQASA